MGGIAREVYRAFEKHYGKEEEWLAYGSIRMEPVFMVLGQSAATAAVQAIDHRVALHDLRFEELRAQLEKDGQVLDPAAGAR